MAWESLGVIAPNTGEWLTYQAAYTAASGAAVFRVTPRDLGLGVIFRTYALVRFKSEQGGVETVTRARRVYPRDEAMVIEADIPGELRNGAIPWFPQVKKSVYRRFIGSTNDGHWRIEIEHLATDGFIDPQFVELEDRLDALSENLTNASDFLY
jgi:hypothetical protein